MAHVPGWPDEATLDPVTAAWVRSAAPVGLGRAADMGKWPTWASTGVNADGKREILGLKVTSSEDGAGWLAFFRGLVARGLSGVVLVTSDAHPGLVAAIAATLPGASWQRCRTH
jgi:putative transposase